MGVKGLGICNLVGICRSGQTFLSNPDKFSGIIKRGKRYVRKLALQGGSQEVG